MGDLSPWMAASVALLFPLAGSLGLCACGAPAQRLVAVQLATSIGLLTLVAMTFAFAQASSIDLALALALLALPSSLLFAIMLERWL